MTTNFFQQQEVKDVLLSRARTINKDTSLSPCLTCSDEGGLFTREYRRWKFMSEVSKVSKRFNEQEREQWFIDNPEPHKYCFNKEGEEI